MSFHDTKKEHGQRPDAGSQLLNEKIPFRSLQVISSDGRHLGTMSREEALTIARQEHLDLVLIAEREGETPIAKVMDYGKASYAKKKQAHLSKKKQKTIQVKEIQLGPKIGEHDLQTKINHMIRFLEEEKHVKVVMSFRGRESMLRDTRGVELYDKIESMLTNAVAGKSVVHEKDQKTATMWSRIYYTK